MASNDVFQKDEEINRLNIQNRLFKPYEQPVYDRVLSGYANVRLLDVGCNNGSKTFDRFSAQNVMRVIGLEHHGDLAAEAQKAYGNDVFAFYQCDVSDPDFARQLTALMAQNNVDAFDVIHLSFILMHLKNPGKLLTVLRGFLAPGGRLIVVEANDSISEVSPDAEGLFQDFLRILNFDPFSGDRTIGSRIPALLEESGYRKVALESTSIQACDLETQKRQAIFDTFCSYLPQDMLFMRQQEPHNTQYVACAEWVERHFAALQNLILAKDTFVSMGVSILTCWGE